MRRITDLSVSAAVLGFVGGLPGSWDCSDRVMRVFLLGSKVWVMALGRVSVG